MFLSREWDRGKKKLDISPIKDAANLLVKESSSISRSHGLDAI
jgi:hypothetical protein